MSTVLSASSGRPRIFLPNQRPFRRRRRSLLALRPGQVQMRYACVNVYAVTA